MPDRNKLSDLLYEASQKADSESYIFDQIADHLIANGVTFAKDNDVPNKWISVKDGLPNLITFDAGTAYSEAVNVLTSGRKVLTAIWDGFEWICDAEFWDAEFEEITHWTTVLLPLPQPPKGLSNG